MSPPKPAIVVVHGAWHIPWHYSPLQNALEKAGYEVTTPHLPSTSSKEPLPDMWPDVRIIQDAIKSYIAKNMDVVVVMHSYGGCVGTTAVAGLRPQDQPNGKGDPSLVYVCAFPLDEGVSLYSFGNGKHAPFARLYGEAGTGILMGCDNPPYIPRDFFYHDCPPEMADEAVKNLRLFSESPCHTKATYAGWKHIEANYLICENDQVLPESLQEMMASQEGGKWTRVEKLAAGHSPFMAKPEETAMFVRKCAGEEL